MLAAHRQDAGCINSLAALLTSCVAKLLLEPQGSYAAIHGRATRPDSTEAITADFLCEALLFTVIKSTYRSGMCSSRRATMALLHATPAVWQRILCAMCHA